MPILDKIIIVGAKEHNLKNINVTIPRDKLVVITGLSGSGKSSLAFDTIYAEGQRRYVESLSTYARQFLNQNQKPEVESIEGLSPAISIEQKSTSHNPRSTVGTLTEIYDYLRLLYARIGKAYCYTCQKPIQGQTVQQIVDTILGYPLGTKFMVAAPIVRGRKGEYRQELKNLGKEGFTRVRIDHTFHELGEEIVLDKQKKHTIEIIIDRLVLKENLKTRLTDSVELALRKTGGLVSVLLLDGEKIHTQLFSESFACHECNVSYPEIHPRLFSFNSPYGACETCKGLGFAMQFDVHKIVPDPTKSLAQGAIAPWANRFSGFYLGALRALAKHYKQSLNIPWSKLPLEFRKIILDGSKDTPIKFNYQNDEHQFHYSRPFEGVIPQLTRRYKETTSDSAREEFTSYMLEVPCKSCHGAKLKKEALYIKIEDYSIYDLCELDIAALLNFFHEHLPRRLAVKDREIAERILKEITARLNFLISVGLDYLTLNRTSATLSGGEAQRIRLATQIGSALKGVIYVLDEPSIGLHQRDNEKLLQTLKALRDLGNTVIVVEHDAETICAADHIIDMGLKAGVHGGTIVAEGSLDNILKHEHSLTGAYLTGKRAISIPEKRRPGRPESIVISGAKRHNLQNITVEFPLGKLICVTGVSGSGKSTLINDTLYQELQALLSRTPRPKSLDAAKITGAHYIDKIIDIDQSPIGKTPRSNPATYTQLFGGVRDLLATLPESRARGYCPGRYSFNVKGGRCEACEGDGVLRIEMHFLPDVFVTCETCQGKRYNRETLEILYKGKNIADILEMTVEEALEFFNAIPTIKNKLTTLKTVGLGYIKLGQSATTLSGGEAQRIKLAKELSKRPTGKTLYILDEPTTGLHFYDVHKLLNVLHALVDNGNTVIVIEHNLEVLKTADHIIDLGPEGGNKGGKLIGTGTPEYIATLKHSYTGQFLAKILTTSKL